MTYRMSQALFLLYCAEPARAMSKAKSVGAHSICARGSLSCRKRARADMESAPTFFVGATIGRPCPFVLWGGLGIFVGMGLDPSVHPAVRCFLAVSYFWQGSTERSRPFPTNLRFFASLGPKYSCPPHGSLPHRLRAEPPRRGGQERAAHSICARGGLSCRKRARADMESAPTFFVGATIGRPCPLAL